VRLLLEGTVDRAVVLFGIDVDPGPELTWARGVSLFAGSSADLDLAHAGPLGVAGEGAAGLAAAEFAAAHPDRVDRLVMVGTPIPAAGEVPVVTAKTLLLYGARDQATGSKHGRWWQQKLPDARLEMHPQGGADLLVPMWKRILSHLAPRCRR
jgi:pimeloyl-ACP methyl ester carboxylesterase